MFAAATSVVALAASAVLYLRRGDEDALNNNNAYILENSVTHARLLPKPSTHAFTYPTLAFFLSLDALESHSLDLGGGWLFGYGGTSWRVTGLRSAAYLLPDSKTRGPQSIKAKLREVLVEHGHDGSTLGDAWTLTMPSYMGYEGINPLSVHYCYTKDEETLAWVVFEIHNTFGEKHVHVFVPGMNENKDCPNGFDHSWTVPRDFHVSPFNDRLGHYAISISAPPPPRSPALVSNAPRPKIRIHLHAAIDSEFSASASSSPDVVGPLKLTATQLARRAVPLTSRNLAQALAQYPFALFLSFVRILYHAWLLHYVRGLDVFPRPDPKPAAASWGLFGPRSIPSESGDGTAQIAPRVYGGIGWQDEGPLEAYTRRITEDFFGRRAEDLGIDVTFVSGDPSVPDRTFSPWSPASGDGDIGREELVIHYTSPRFFTTLLLAPSAEHLLLLKRTDDLFRVSSDELLVRAFSADPTAGSPLSLTQMLRASFLPHRFVSAAAIEAQHPLDSNSPRLLNAFAVCLLHLADVLEKNIFTLLRARFVPGTEPWRRWERAAAPGP